MKHFPIQLLSKSCLLPWIAALLMGCSQNPDEASGSGKITSGLRKEVTDIICPVHEVPVSKVEASYGIACRSWDPKLGLTIGQIKERFPYAVWDSNIYQVDDSPDAKIEQYNLVCERCTASWMEYVSQNAPPLRNQRLVINIASSGEITIHGSEFSVEQLPAIVKAISAYHSDVPIVLRADSETPTAFIKPVVEACEKGGVKNIAFGASDL